MSPAQPFPSTLKGKAREPPRPPPSRLPHAMNEPPPRRTEMQEEVEKRERAAMILDSWELLALYSRKYRESIPQTRLRFEQQMIGVEDESEVEWEDEKEEVKVGDGKGGGAGSRSGKQMEKDGGSGNKGKGSGKS